ncbi:hypothetical protein QJQ45_001890 [Haematococcus lacustris]|nr:hypothetical protein QJQ45_001890 [Haematococcus lacustris]
MFQDTVKEVWDDEECYALLMWFHPDLLHDELLPKYLKQYGDADASVKDAMTFEEFSALFAKPPTEVPGEGNCIGYAAQDTSGVLAPYRFNRRSVGPEDVHIQISFAGICHSDIHTGKGEWAGTCYPCVPGHEIAGYVIEVGDKVTKFKVGDKVGVGCMVNSCKSCHCCSDLKEEQYCQKGFVGTYNGKDRDGSITKGGYSTHVVVDQDFVLNVPQKLSLDAAAPLLCAGITVYSPIRKFELDKPGMKVGVVGLGGLGHMAVKFLKSFGVEVTVISTSPSKKEEATTVLGADIFLVSKDPDAMAAAAGTLDGLINTVSARHDLAALLNLLKTDGTMVRGSRLRVTGSLIGGIKETQEMLDYCAEKGIECMHEIIPADYVNTAWERVLKQDVRYRFVIDVQGSLI